LFCLGLRFDADEFCVDDDRLFRPPAGFGVFRLEDLAALAREEDERVVDCF